MSGRNGPAAQALAAALWLNAPSGFSLAALRGKVVALDFWTYSRVECVHPAPELEKLQAQYPGKLAVVGVHAPEYDAQKQPERLRQAVIREDVTFPVLSDPDHATWKAYGIKACPAVVFLGPDGREAARLEGPAKTQDIDRLAERLVGESKGRLDLKPLELPQERDALAPSPLAYPGKVSVDEAGRRIFVSDSGHNRVIIADLSGRVEKIIGSGQDGVTDGSFSSAALRHPQGTALIGDDLYIADEGNDRVRQADLKRGLVRTMRQTFDMAAPRDLAFANDRLFIAAAGFHNVMMLNTHAGTLTHYAGNGREGSEDGALSAASLAQPSGLAAGEGLLFVADSESGAVRSIDLADPAVRTPAKGLSHPLGLAYAAGALYIADAYSGQIKRLDPKTGELEAIAGGFSEPGGLAPFQGGLLVADTGNHRLVKLSLDGKERSELVLKGLRPPPQAPPTMPMPEPAAVTLPEAAVRAGKSARVSLDVTLPAGYRLHPLAPFFYGVLQTSGPIRFDPKSRKGALAAPKPPIAVEFTAQEGRSEALLNVAFYYCRADGKGLCRARSVTYTLPIAASARERGSTIVIPIAAD